MSNKTDIYIRRAVYIFFIVLFLILAPSIILYTQGFRYNTHYNKLQKTGILVVSSEPKKASIYLNNILAPLKETPARIGSLASGDYEIKLSLGGYHDWQKKLPIQDGITTFAEDIILWKESKPAMVKNYSVDDWLESPDKIKTAFIDSENNLVILNLENDEFTNPLKLPGEGKFKIIEWSITSKKIIIENEAVSEKKYFIVNVDSPEFKIINLGASEIPNNIKKIEWDLKSDNTIYSLNSEGIWQTDIFHQRKDLVFNIKDINDFIVSDEIIYFIQNDILYQRELNSNKSATEIKKIDSSNYIFIHQYFPRLILIDSLSQKLVLIDKKQVQPDIKSTAIGFNWLNSDSFLFYNNWEIWIYDTDKKEPDLITRTGQPIQKAIWHPLGRHIFFASDNKIKIIELDNRELRNIIDLADFNELGDLSIDNKGFNLYFNGQIINQKGIFQLQLRESRIIGLLPNWKL